MVNKTHVFGMRKHDGKIYAQIIKNYSTNELIPILYLLRPLETPMMVRLTSEQRLIVE